MEPVLTELKARLSVMKVGAPLDETTEMGPLANKAHYEKILALFEKARQEGNEIIYGGQPIAGTGYFVPPTIIRANSPDDALMKEETFGLWGHSSVMTMKMNLLS